MEPKLSEKLCPRCKENYLYEEEALNALSRVDNETYICPPCGTGEALRDYFGVPAYTSWKLEDADG